MIKLLKQGISLLKFVLSAKNTRGYGVQSANVYDFVDKVVYNRSEYYAWGFLDEMRKRLRSDNTPITVTDFGAGSAVGAVKSDTISQIARRMAKPKRYARMFFRMVQYLKPVNVIELGTSLGLSTMHMAKADSGIPVYTIEGCPHVARFAGSIFRANHFNNIQIINGNISSELHPLLVELGTAGMVFIDGNHQYEPVMQYFNEVLQFADKHTVIIVDDIYWSEGMQKAWREIKAHSKVFVTIDLWSMGIVFLNSDWNRNHFKMI